MIRLMSIIYALAGPTLAGIFMTAALTMNRVDPMSIIVTVAAGFLLALPISWFVAKRLSENG